MRGSRGGSELGDFRQKGQSGEWVHKGSRVATLAVYEALEGTCALHARGECREDG
jgi:hypothetical protein